MQLAKIKLLVTIPLLLSITAHANQTLTVSPSIEVKADYSDNIVLDTDDVESIVVGQVNPGIYISHNGFRTQFDLGYQLHNIYYSEDRVDNRQYHYLNAYGEYQFLVDHLTWYATSDIAPRTINIYENSIIDTVSGSDELGEVYRASTGILWEQDSGPNEVNIDTSINIVKYDHEELDDNKGLEWSLNESVNPANQAFFWQLDNDVSYSYTADDENSKFATLAAQGGIAIHSSFDIIVNGYWEIDKTESPDDGEIKDTTINAGPGIRWSPGDNGYITLSYNFALNEESEDYLGSNFLWSPTPRTMFNGTYQKRYYGDAYSFTAKQQLHRIATALGYKESLSSFNRELFDDTTDTGSQTSSVYLLRSANWLTSYTTERSKTSFSVSREKREYIFLTEQSEIDNGVTLEWNYKLTRLASLSIQANLRNVIEDDGSAENKALVQFYELAFNKQLSRKLDAELSYQYRQRQTDDDDDDEYTENRISLGLTYNF